MSILETPATSVPTATRDVRTIAALGTAFAAQRAAFATDRRPSIEARRERLGALIGMMLANRERISAAVAQDFGAHPVPASDLIEVLGVVGRAQHVLEHLEEWMAPSPRHTDPAMLGTARAHIEYQPKGVIGNIVPWNFPFDLSVGPMVDMLAAGNRVIIKPSEYTPACADLLAEMVACTFDPDLVTVAVGGLELARAFSSMPWDHLLYTGSPGVGRQVMQAAAANLTPVTLELGGKCPAIMTPNSVTETNVESVIGTKLIKSGQMCVSVDYALVPRGDLDTFVAHAQSFMARAAPNYSRGEECTGMISTRHLQRIEDMLEEARASQCRIVTLEEDGRIDRETRRMPMSLAIAPSQNLRIMQEEIFGPILPVVPYDDLDDALEAINAGERPLGLYVFGDDAALTEHVLAATHSGGAAVNTCAIQSALPSMGFGGSGMSGMGRHHGIEGFREFSNPRGVVVRGAGDLIDVFYAPYAKAAGLVQAVLSGT
ncbi:aldehyde dehydrogenase family protein [Sphingomonas sp. AAP5]|uniref:aldehyde dehydrogenase family protein n=1 Tax=Sphingomonas sp. AAP5 TaxID=1523415 RepID=UPI0010575DFE|nr:aldehyde dehydrogenase family protein [Sphingomonas sp. AAP5]QBM76581.1 aldehyde dehydrogenase family protein [Sphingomonas sp. AAP5]